MDIGNQIRERRQRLGLSQDALAQKLYVSRVTISHWETGKTLPDVQSMLLLANLFDTTIDELVKGSVDEMQNMVERDDRRTRLLSVVLGTVTAIALTALIVVAVAARDILDPVMRLLLAVLVFAFSSAVLVARRDGTHGQAKSAAEVLGAATGSPVERARQSGAANGMRLVLQMMTGLGVALVVLIVSDVLMGEDGVLTVLLWALAIGVICCAAALGRFTRASWTAAILPTAWVVLAAVLGMATGGIAFPRDVLAVAGGVLVLLISWVEGRSRRDKATSSSK